MDPILTVLTIGDVERPLGTYGLFLSLGVLVGSFMVLRAASRAGLDVGRVIAILALTVGGGLFGAYALFALVTLLTTGSFEPLRQGGLVFFGAVGGGGLTIALVSRPLRVPWLRLADEAVTGLGVGHALGRMGCFLGGCCYGRPSDVPWAVVYDHPLGYFVDSVARHPVPLYESAFLLVLAAASALLPRAARRSGARAIAYLGAYALGRLILESFRGDALRGVFFGVSTSQFLSIVILGVVAVLVMRARRSPIAVSELGAASLTALLVFTSISPATGQLRAASLDAPLTEAERPRLRRPVRRGAVVTRPGVIFIDSGWFVRGSDASDARDAIALCLLEHRFVFAGFCLEEEFVDEQPRRRIFVSEFGIDRTEVTHAAYRACVAAGGCNPSRISPADQRLAAPDHPVAGVTWKDAAAYCEFVGGRLPTEAEWEKAARGPSPRLFPWGKFYNDRLANHGRAGFVPDGVDGHRYAAPVGSYPDAVSPYGLVDMAGNVWEWTADRYQLEWYMESPAVDPKGPDSGGDRVVRGGSWRYPPHGLRVTHRRPMPEGLSAPDVGFRCAYDPR